MDAPWLPVSFVPVSVVGRPVSNHATATHHEIPRNRLKTSSLAEKLTNRFLDCLTAKGEAPHA